MARPSRGALGDQVVLDRREQRKERGHDLRLGVALALDLDVLLERREGDAGLAGGVEDGDDPEERDLALMKELAEMRTAGAPIPPALDSESADREPVGPRIVASRFCARSLNTPFASRRRDASKSDGVRAADPDRQRLRHGRADHRPPSGRHRPPAFGFHLVIYPALCSSPRSHSMTLARASRSARYRHRPRPRA